MPEPGSKSTRGHNGTRGSFAQLHTECGKCGNSGKAGRVCRLSKCTCAELFPYQQWNSCSVAGTGLCTLNPEAWPPQTETTSGPTDRCYPLAERRKGAALHHLTQLPAYTSKFHPPDDDPNTSSERVPIPLGPETQLNGKVGNVINKAFKSEISTSHLRIRPDIRKITGADFQC